MKVHFTKMQGAGNDYIYIDCIRQSELQSITDEQWAQISIKWSNRHFGIGGDGIVLILPSQTCDVRMRIFNADGSEAEMCGNASRCIGRYMVYTNLIQQCDLTLETLAGIKSIHVAEQVTVDMGFAQDIITGCRLNDYPEENEFTAVNMGNPHAVFIVPEINDTLVLDRGPLYENDSVFPHRSNIEFIRILDAHNIDMRVWERGSGETLACGTGACAAAVASIANGYCQSPVSVHLIGGTLIIEVSNELQIKKTGPAEIVFAGNINL